MASARRALPTARGTTPKGASVHIYTAYDRLRMRWMRILISTVCEVHSLVWVRMSTHTCV